jgi:phage gp46-like protein
MTDKAIAFDLTRGVFDYAMLGSQLVLDTGLSTSIIMSWFCDKRAGDNDVLPDEQPGPFGLNHRRGGDRRGNWGDFMTPAARGVLPGQPYPTPAFQLGSRFWMFQRRKLTDGLVNEVRIEGADCLSWMKTYGVARDVTVTAKAVGRQTILCKGVITPVVGAPADFLLPVIVGGGSWPLPPAVASGQNGALGVFVLDQDQLS